jgi:hypothetical protein
MAGIDIAPLADRLADDEIDELTTSLKQAGVSRLNHGSDDAATVITEDLDDDILEEFLDRLEVHDLACEIYLPEEFEGRVEVADVRVGSAASLIEVLDEMRDELFADEDEDEDYDDEDEDEEEEDEGAVIEGKLRHVWKLFYTGAQAAVDRHLPLHIQS